MLVTPFNSTISVEEVVPENSVHSSHTSDCIFSSLPLATPDCKTAASSTSALEQKCCRLMQMDSYLPLSLSPQL